MIFTASKGQPFREEFTFKNEKGKPVAIPRGDYRLVLERGDYVREGNLKIAPNAIYWNMTAEETQALAYSTLYFTLAFNGQEIARGVLRVN